jgi:hypothetical protein
VSFIQEVANGSCVLQGVATAFSVPCYLKHFFHGKLHPGTPCPQLTVWCFERGREIALAGLATFLSRAYKHWPLKS